MALLSGKYCTTCASVNGFWKRIIVMKKISDLIKVYLGSLHFIFKFIDDCMDSLLSRKLSYIIHWLIINNTYSDPTRRLSALHTQHTQLFSLHEETTVMHMLVQVWDKNHWDIKSWGGGVFWVLAQSSQENSEHSAQKTPSPIVKGAFCVWFSLFTLLLGGSPISLNGILGRYP